jgi:hypothetical protein
MTSRLAAMCLVTMFLISVSYRSIQAQQSGAMRMELKDVSAVYVVVEELSDSAKAIGLASGGIQTDVELKLVLVGMHVVTREEGQKLQGRPFIYVRITLTKSGEAGYVAVELDEDALLERNNQRAFRMTTWDTGTISAHPTAQVIREVVKDDVGEFLNDWRAVNPTK